VYKFALYFSKNFLFTWLITVFGLLVLIGLLDSLANGSDIIASSEGFTGTFKYMFLRAPVIFDRIFIFTLVVAILLVFMKLVRQNELVALLGFGVSAPKQIILLTPVVLAASIASITFVDTAMAPAVRALQAWGIGEYKEKNITKDSPLWLEDGQNIVRATQRLSYNELGDIQIFERDKEGSVKTVIWAEIATFKNPNWELDGVKILTVTGSNGEKRSALRDTTPRQWETQQTPTSIARLAADPRDISLAEMRGFGRLGTSGTKPRFAYEFWFAHRLTRPIAILILLLCCVPLMQRTGREDTGEKHFIIGITIAFGFLIVDGAMATFATTGGVIVSTAITFPLAVFGLLGAFMLVRTESLWTK
jgi:lipopolysaccharide export system permease protein